MIAAVLHDVTDDTAVSLAEVEAAFGEQVTASWLSSTRNPTVILCKPRLYDTAASLAEAEAAFGEQARGDGLQSGG